MTPKQLQYKVHFEHFATNRLNDEPIDAETLKKAIHYSFLNGGKRIRAILCFSAGKMFQTTDNNINLAAFALESIHAYSLIHDDLPAMDDDSLRRGKPTCHIQFNEATAILAGDALQSLAFNALADCDGISLAQLKKVISTLALLSGSNGMVSGQQLDLEAENKAIDLETLERIHLLKTGALIDASILLPFYLSSFYPNDALEKALCTFSRNIGLAFQVKDDLLDITSSTETLGKNAQSDLKQHKATYPALIGIKQTQLLLNTLISDAYQALDTIKHKFDITLLREITTYITQRKY
ncbi:polyprenyl synthetase family protein [Fangia hongkongensis]|uniref:polyprenyl synthetase family protein n=1 Tax=Fangia hongkongensis TaxID=270495 RepID=UPI00035CBC73|nr:farnesyl diphosphate synthase [Fangia hongkongensis]MBK2124578.1 polyprenyl synthetase family protein [Fangia hongkongensis]